MTAREMFEELGYEYNEMVLHNVKELLVYDNKKLEIQFDVKCKYFHTWANEYVVIFTPELIRPITQQMKELGWIE